MIGGLHPTKNRLWGGFSCNRMTAPMKYFFSLVCAPPHGGRESPAGILFLAPDCACGLSLSLFQSCPCMRCHRRLAFALWVGPPETLLSDRGLEFESELIKELQRVSNSRSGHPLASAVSVFPVVDPSKLLAYIYPERKNLASTSILLSCREQRLSPSNKRSTLCATSTWG